VALLRGINVGGANVIPMAELRAAFETLGLVGVATYIQSGNVLFSGGGDAVRLARRIERGLSEELGYSATIVLRSHAQMQAIVSGAPRGFGAAADRFRYDVVFLKEPLDAAEAMQSVRAREGVDEAHAGDGVIYFSRLIARASQSHLPRLVSTPVYRHMTIRNWNTTTKLLRLMEG
jgi:uncharacterized protein (DUF1697 family)